MDMSNLIINNVLGENVWLAMLASYRGVFLVTGVNVDMSQAEDLFCILILIFPLSLVK